MFSRLFLLALCYVYGVEVAPGRGPFTLSGSARVVSLGHAAGRLARAGATAVLVEDGKGKGSFRAALEPAAGDLGLGSPRGIAHLAAAPEGQGMGGKWQAGLLTGGLRALGSGGLGRLGGESVPGNTGSAGALMQHALGAGTGTGPHSPPPPPPPAVYASPSLYLPFGPCAGFTLARGATLPTSFPLPPGFSILPEEDAAGPSGAAFLAAGITARGDAAAEAAAASAGQALTALAPAVGQKHRPSATERAAAAAVAAAAGAPPDASYLTQRAALMDLIRSARDPSLPPRATRQAGLAEVIGERMARVSMAIAENLNGMSGIRDLEDSCALAVTQAFFLLPLPSPLAVAMAEERAGVSPARDASSRALTLVPFHAFVGAIMLCAPIPHILTAGLRSWGREGAPGGRHGNCDPPTHMSGAVLEALAHAKLAGRSSEEGDSDFQGTLDAVAAAAVGLHNGRAAAGIASATAAAVREDRARKAGAPPSPYGQRATAPTAIPDSQLATAIGAALMDLSRASKVRALIAERVRAARAAGDAVLRALARWGFTRMAHIVKMPPGELLPAIEGAYPPLLPPGAAHVDACACAVGGAQPPLGIAVLLAAVTQQWLGGNQEAQRAAALRAGAYDARFTRGPTDPRRVGGRKSEKEHVLAASLKALAGTKLEIRGDVVGELGALRTAAPVGYDVAVHAVDGGRVKPGAVGVRQSVASSLGREAARAARGAEAARADDAAWEAAGGAPAVLAQPPLHSLAAPSHAHPAAALLDSGFAAALAEEARGREEEQAWWARVAAARGEELAAQAAAEAEAGGAGARSGGGGEEDLSHEARARVRREGIKAQATGVYVMRDGKRPGAAPSLRLEERR